MAVLSDDNRSAVWADLMQKLSNNREAIAVTKTELRAAVNAVDDWVDANKASYNTALPEPFRTTATAAQKAQLLLYVVSKRFEEGA